MHVESNDDIAAYEAGPMEECYPHDEAGHDEDLERIAFFVAGEPIPQGSTRSFYIKKLDRVVTTHMNRNTEGWRQRIATEAQHVNSARSSTFFTDDRCCGYDVRLHFMFSKPKSAPKRKTLNTKRPDLDKLVRAALDGITGILIYDDSQVIGITATKSYCRESEGPGLHIEVKKIMD
ncbi:MAG TPA: RusA family crossover junction endodeoxyribonuclease [Methanomassiliicoccales archaeon]|nr:RusA family crossover junction endodeoxyribonuclease [Methanomassiliicoccales archaeon]